MAYHYSKDKDSVSFFNWQYTAVVLTEISMGLNLVITPVFWIFFGHVTFEHLSWHGWDLVLRCTWASHHTFPIITSFINLYISDQYFCKKDWKILGLTGFSYIFANAFGTYMLGHPVYPVLDWKNVPKTFCEYAIQIPILIVLHYLMALITQWVYKKRN